MARRPTAPRPSLPTARAPRPHPTVARLRGRARRGGRARPIAARSLPALQLLQDHLGVLGADLSRLRKLGESLLYFLQGGETPWRGSVQSRAERRVGLVLNLRRQAGSRQLVVVARLDCFRHRAVVLAGGGRAARGVAHRCNDGQTTVLGADVPLAGI